MTASNKSFVFDSSKSSSGGKYLEVKPNDGYFARVDNSIDGLAAGAVIYPVAGAVLNQPIAIPQLIKLLGLYEMIRFAIDLLGLGLAHSVPHHGSKYPPVLIHEPLHQRRLFDARRRAQNDGVAVLGHVFLARGWLGVLFVFVPSDVILKDEADLLGVVNFVKRRQLKS
ncbi:hypothetical protein Trco_007459 [Trichoderma cornu-damae]|uniref:Uncharacterized protein n=1 Tax=Trichoderma cornu-damae TaxID=654480 RepID=A0A9P8TT95_9HYPO|nr:hypothetical protein Trco_007459 [Trichoderma cornu-damae]